MTRRQPSTDRATPIPVDIQQRLVRLAAAFQIKTGASAEDIQAFMAETFKVYSDYLEWKL